MKPALSFLLLLFAAAACNNDHKNTVKSHAPASKKWLGNWERNERMNEASVEITGIDGDSISFHLIAANGGHTGDLEGKALVDGHTARFYEANGYDTCEINFTLQGDTLISIEQVRGDCDAAMGVSFNGNYYNSETAHTGKDLPDPETLKDLGMLADGYEDSLFRQMTGDSVYDMFLSSTQLISDENTDLDSLKATVRSAGIRGLYMEMENIVMVDSAKNIYAAVIDDHKVLYFTTNKAMAGALPKTIDNWRTNFKDYPVIYRSQQ